jgi:hypothetical protein
VVVDATIWSQRLVRVFFGVAWPDLGGRVHYNLVSELSKNVLWSIMTQPGWLGTLNFGIRAQVSNTYPGWVEKVELI